MLKRGQAGFVRNQSVFEHKCAALVLRGGRGRGRGAEQDSGKALTPGVPVRIPLGVQSQGELWGTRKGLDLCCHLALGSIYEFSPPPSYYSFRSRGSRPLHLLGFTCTRVTWLLLMGTL